MKMLNVKTTNNYFERTETLTKYYENVREYDVLDAATEKKLFEELVDCRERIKTAKLENDLKKAASLERHYKEIREVIINANLRFVISVARVFASNNNILDLINEGNIGLVEAVDSFDPSLGNRFQTHAVYLIRQKINLFRQGPDLMIRKNNVSKTYHIMSNMTNKFMQEFQREPTSDELKDYINKHYPKAAIKDAADCLTVRMSSIDEPVETDDNDAVVGTMLQYNTASATVNDYEGIAELEHYRSVIESLLKGFSERDKAIIKMHFGIGQEQGRQASAPEIGAKVGLTPERVRQIIASSIKEIQKEYSKRITSF